MTDGELRDELVTLLLAGHETTATAGGVGDRAPACATRDKLARLTAEIDGGDGEEYMTAVVNETLRVRPVVPIVVRLLSEDLLRVGGYELPAGTRVVASIYLTNRNPRVYEDPRRVPPRALPGGAPETFSWIPFGGGIRRCIGASFAHAGDEADPAHHAQRAAARAAARAQVAPGRVEPPARDHAGAGGGRAGRVAAARAPRTSF